MIFERRKKPSGNKPELKPVELPIDYLKIVEETLTESLDKGIEELKKIHSICELKASGAIYSDEVLLAITISHGPKNLIATTVYASAEFNPLMPEPGIELVLSNCLDSAGSVLEHYLNPAFPERISQFASSSIGTLEEAPFEWTPMEETKVSVWVKIDKSNPVLETLTDEWLKLNDPNYSKEDEAAEAEEFLNDRLDAIQKAKSGSGSGSGSGDSGPIRH